MRESKLCQCHKRLEREIERLRYKKREIERDREIETERAPLSMPYGLSERAVLVDRQRKSVLSAVMSLLPTPNMYV